LPSTISSEIEVISTNFADINPNEILHVRSLCRTPAEPADDQYLFEAGITVGMIV